MFIKYLEEWIANNTEKLESENIRVEHTLNYLGDKLEVGFSNILNNNAGSCELLKNGTCDLMVINYKTDKTDFYQTLILKDVNELKMGLYNFLLKLKKIETNE